VNGDRTAPSGGQRPRAPTLDPRTRAELDRLGPCIARALRTTKMDPGTILGDVLTEVGRLAPAWAFIETGGNRMDRRLPAAGVLLGVVNVLRRRGEPFETIRAVVLDTARELALLELTREDALVVAVGESSPAGVTPAEGAVTCYSEDSLCGREERAMDVEAPDGTTVSLDNGESAQVGDLMVTNDRFIHNYDVSGGCNFGLSVEYLMSTVPAK
jgi:hypothetical protein